LLGWGRAVLGVGFDRDAMKGGWRSSICGRKVRSVVAGLWVSGCGRAEATADLDQVSDGSSVAAIDALTVDPSLLSGLPGALGSKHLGARGSWLSKGP
jgi:hypothetical protein